MNVALHLALSSACNKGRNGMALPKKKGQRAGNRTYDEFALTIREEQGIRTHTSSNTSVPYCDRLIIFRGSHSPCDPCCEGCLSDRDRRCLTFATASQTLGTYSLGVYFIRVYVYFKCSNARFWKTYNVNCYRLLGA